MLGVTPSGGLPLWNAPHAEPLPVPPRVRLERVRVNYRDADLLVRVTRGVGWRAVCACSWRGPFRRTLADARADRRDHLSGKGCV